MDKSEAMLSFLQTCPYLQSNPLFFNFGSVEDNAHQAITHADDVPMHRPYVDGSVSRRFTFSIDSFKSVAYNSVIEGFTDENLEEFEDVTSIIHWVNEQGDNRIFPDFGEGYFIDEMKTLSSEPELQGVDTTLNPPMAVYRISIQIDYIDNTKKLWN